MYGTRATRKKVLKFEAEVGQVCAQRKTTAMKQLSKSLGDLPNFKKGIDEKLNGKLPKSSPHLQQTRRLGETKLSPEVDDKEAYLVTKDCLCVLQHKICGEALHLKNRYSFTPPPSRDGHDQRLKEIARDNANSTSLYPVRQKALKVDDIVHTASKLEAEFLKRAKSPVYRTNCTVDMHRNCSICRENCYSEKLKPNSELKKRTLVVKIPAMSDNLSEHDYRGGWGSYSNFSYRHKK